jgi:hypothetical protein
MRFGSAGGWRNGAGFSRVLVLGRRRPAVIVHQHRPLLFVHSLWLLRVHRFCRLGMMRV